jgi:hypothetical protein
MPLPSLKSVVERAAAAEGVLLPGSAPPGDQEAVKAANRATRTANLARIAAEEATRDAEIKRTEAEHAAASAKSAELQAKQQLSHALKREERLSKDLGTVTEERERGKSEIRSLQHTIDEHNRKIEILQERANNLEYEALENPKLQTLILQLEDEKALTYKRLVGLEHQQHAVERESKEWEAKAAERTRQMIQLQKERSEAVREITSIKTKVMPDLVKTGIMSHSQVKQLEMQLQHETLMLSKQVELRTYEYQNMHSNLSKQLKDLEESLTFQLKESQAAHLLDGHHASLAIENLQKEKHQQLEMQKEQMEALMMQSHANWHLQSTALQAEKKQYQEAAQQAKNACTMAELQVSVLKCT